MGQIPCSTERISSYIIYHYPVLTVLLLYVCAQTKLESMRSCTSSIDTRLKTLGSLYGCALRVVSVANSDSDYDSVIVLLLDILSALHDTARHDSHVAWRGVVKQLTEAKSEVERYRSRDLAAVTKKLAQMRDSL